MFKKLNVSSRLSLMHVSMTNLLLQANFTFSFAFNDYLLQLNFIAFRTTKEAAVTFTSSTCPSSLLCSCLTSWALLLHQLGVAVQQQSLILPVVLTTI